MFTCAIDERLGLMVGHHHGGGGKESIPQVVRAVRQLAQSPTPGAQRSHKVFLLLVDTDASHPDSREREQLADSWKAMSTPCLFAMVSSSIVARAVFTVISLLRGREANRTLRAAFATRDEALAWIERERHGVRGELLRLDARQHAKVDAHDHRDSLQPRPSMSIARTEV